MTEETSLQFMSEKETTFKNPLLFSINSRFSSSLAGLMKSVPFMIISSLALDNNSTKLPPTRETNSTRNMRHNWKAFIFVLFYYFVIDSGPSLLPLSVNINSFGSEKEEGRIGFLQAKFGEKRETNKNWSVEEEA